MPWSSTGQPVLLNMPGSESNYLPVFTTEARLRACLERGGVEFDSIKQITDGFDFLDSVPPSIVVIYDPLFTTEGRVRFRQIQR